MDAQTAAWSTDQPKNGQIRDVWQFRAGFASVAEFLERLLLDISAQLSEGPGCLTSQQHCELLRAGTATQSKGARSPAASAAMDAAFRKLQAEKAAERGETAPKAEPREQRQAPEPRPTSPSCARATRPAGSSRHKLATNTRPRSPTRRRDEREARDGAATPRPRTWLMGNWRGRPATGSPIRMGIRAGPVGISFWPRDMP